MARRSWRDAGSLAPGPLALIELLNGPDAPQYAAGKESFYAITRYNWSSCKHFAVEEQQRAKRLVVRVRRHLAFIDQHRQKHLDFWRSHVARMPQPAPSNEKRTLHR